MLESVVLTETVNAGVSGTNRDRVLKSVVLTETESAEVSGTNRDCEC